MQAIIIYGSQYGTTKKYAEKLAEMTNSDICSYDNIKSLSGYDLIVHMGGLYAGGVKGLKQTLKAFPKEGTLFIVTVGLADVHDPENIANIKKSLKSQVPADIYNKAAVFHLRGGIDYSKLGFAHKTMMNLLYKSVKKEPPERQTPENRAIIETFNKKVDFTDFEALKPIAQAMEKKTDSNGGLNP